MSIPLARKFEGKKFMWDGAVYETEDLARQAMEVYRKRGFDVQISQNTDKYLVYSRRIASVQAEKS
jgi:hypothetical protein